MKTSEILRKYEYKSVGGPIEAIPVSDALDFCQRILDMLSDIGDGVRTLHGCEKEIKEAMENLGSK